MRLEIIETPDYILAVSDEKPTVGNQFIYETDTQTINTTCSDYTPNEFDFIIKAYQPKGNAKELDLPFLPEVFRQDPKLPMVFSEEDLRKAFERGFSVATYLADYETEKEWSKFIQSLKQPKWFVAEHIGKCCGNQLINQCINCKKYKPQLKTTTIKGKTYLVGKYE